jgi:NADH-quinone oxidoreductase subunit M
LKRLIAFTSINHLAYVPVALGVAALAADRSVAQLAVDGAILQMVSHGLLTGAMFLLLGIIQHRAGTRDIDRLRGLWIAAPGLSGVLALVAFGSFGLPGLSGFVAELQVIGAALAQSVWIAVAIVVALVVMTAVYLRMVTRLLLGEPSEEAARLADSGGWRLAPASVLAAASVLIGILPGAIVTMIAASAPLVAH